MNTIAPRLAKATTAAVRQPSFHHLAASATTTHGSGTGTVIVLVLAILFVAALSSAARGLAAVISELLRAAAAVTSVLFSIVIAIFVAVAFLAHH